MSSIYIVFILLYILALIYALSNRHVVTLSIIFVFGILLFLAIYKSSDWRIFNDIRLENYIYRRILRDEGYYEYELTKREKNELKREIRRLLHIHDGTIGESQYKSFSERIRYNVFGSSPPAAPAPDPPAAPAPDPPAAPAPDPPAAPAPDQANLPTSSKNAPLQGSPT